MNLDVAADIGKPELKLTEVSGTANARNLRMDGQDYGDIVLNARTGGQTVQYQATSTFAGSSIRLTGSTQLQPGYETSADANISNLAIERVLAAARRTDIPAKGSLARRFIFPEPRRIPREAWI